MTNSFAVEVMMARFVSIRMLLLMLVTPSSLLATRGVSQS